MSDGLVEVTGWAPVPVYLAVAQRGQDDAAAARPGVVVVHEAFGLNDDIRRIADRFAAHGYHAVAPDLLASGTRVGCLVRMVRELSAGRGRTFDEIQACRAWLADRADCSGEVGVAGFCLGGAFALLLAGRGFGASAVQ